MQWSHAQAGDLLKYVIKPAHQEQWAWEGPDERAEPRVFEALEAHLARVRGEPHRAGRIGTS